MRPAPRLLALITLNALAQGLWLARATSTGPRQFLQWNLFLAAVPWLVALALPYARSARLYWPLFFVWLAFFPNAPYLVTDFVHLRARPPVPLWFDVLFFSAFAAAGCALGWDSLARVHGSLRRRIGARAALVIVALTVVLCGFGVFLGRFARLNSWDVLVDPLQVVRSSAQALSQPRALVFSLAFSALVGAGYLFCAPARDALDEPA